MKNSSDFISKIENIDVSFYNQFNWFKVMYKMTEERSLHSRMIAFLLNPEGSHNQGDLFLKLFLEGLGILDFDLNQVRVYPEEGVKKEEDNIDILIINGNKEAIIIENKIFASDSNKENFLESESGNCTHKYQIPRYYYKVKCKGFTVKHICYLTVKHDKPSFYKHFPQVVKDILIFKDYIQSVLDWLDKCILYYAKDDVFKLGLEQYKQATTEFLNDMNLALQLKEISAQHIEEAFNFWTKTGNNPLDKFYVIKNQFIHVKWHTVHEFYTSLKHKIEENFNVTVSEIINEDITDVTHYKKKKALSLTFTVNDKLYYVCNDAKGISIGCDVINKTEDDFKVILDQNYAWFNFANHEVFQLLDTVKKMELVDVIVGELNDLVINSPKNLRN